MIIFTVVFSLFIRVPTEGLPYPLFSYLAPLFWRFSANSISLGASSLVNNMNLITKIYFPREILPLSAVIASLVDLAVAALVFVALFVGYRVPLQLTVLWVPALLIIQVAMTLAVTLIAAAVNVYYRDVRFIVPLALQLWMYVSPVGYPVSLVPEQYRPIYMLNPMAVLLDSYRRTVLLGQPPDLMYLEFSAGMAIGLLALAYLFFRRIEWQFADMI